MSGRIRSLKPETLEDERPAGLSDAAWRLWVSLMLLADDHGNTRAAPSWLAGQVWWNHSRKPDVAALLAELEGAGSITVYRVRGQVYAHVNRWERHQRIDNAGRPRVPTPEEAANGGESPRVAEDCRSDLDLEKDPEGEKEHDHPGQVGLKGGPSAEDFAAAYALYPRKEGRKRGLARLKAQITTPEKYGAFVRAVKHYAASVQGTETRYVKHFDSFVTCWEDYADGAPPPRNGVPQRPGGFMPPRGAADETREEDL